MTKEQNNTDKQSSNIDETLKILVAVGGELHSLQETMKGIMVSYEDIMNSYHELLEDIARCVNQLPPTPVQGKFFNTTSDMVGFINTFLELNKDLDNG